MENYINKLSKVIFITLLCIFTTLSAKAKEKVIYTQPITKTFNFSSTPAGAKVYYQGRLVCASTPGTANITCKGVVTPGKKKEMDKTLQRAGYDSRLTFTFVKDGYITQEVDIEAVVTPQRKGLGELYLFDWPTSVGCDMQRDPNSAYSKDTSIPDGEANKVVSRDRPGQTALERTIIRWYFESEPQGARIFWRVISSIPDQVKNTNELWLGTTPFEETRSFNIQGLTYENFRNVQIEIKVRRNGYLDQTKRFNVRQAIDQQEISSFFDLIKAEE